MQFVNPSALITPRLVPHDRISVPTINSVRKPRIQDTLFMATSRTDLGEEQATPLIGHRFASEVGFRDSKDDRSGVGLKETTIGTPERQTRMHFVLALACVELTALRATGEQLGLGVRLRANTVQMRRTQVQHYVAGLSVLALTVASLLLGFHLAPSELTTLIAISTVT